MKQTLYELVGEAAALEAAVSAMEDSGGLAADLMREELTASDGRLAEKLEAYARVIRNAEGLAATIKAEEVRLAERRRAAENRAAKLKGVVLDALRSLGREKASAGPFVYRLQPNGGALPLILTVAPEELPEEYLCRRVEADTGALREALEDGVSIPGAALGERGVHLRLT